MIHFVRLVKITTLVLFVVGFGLLFYIWQDESTAAISLADILGLLVITAFVGWQVGIFSGLGRPETKDIHFDD